MIEKYDIEDVIIAELRKMSSTMAVDDVDVGRVHFIGVIQVDLIAERLFDLLRIRGLLNK